MGCQRLWYFLVMGALMLRAHLPKRHGVEASPLGLGQGNFSPAEVGRALQESRHAPCRGQAPVQPSLLEIVPHSIGPAWAHRAWVGQ